MPPQSYHGKLQNTDEDQLTLAAIHFLRHQFQQATEIYKHMLLENRLPLQPARNLVACLSLRSTPNYSAYLALNVYVALCYFKLEYFDVSLDVLNIYLDVYDKSAVGINLKACNHFRMYNGKSAEIELQPLIDFQSVAHNVENSLDHDYLVLTNHQCQARVPTQSNL
eukprot:gene6181-6018_t